MGGVVVELGLTILHIVHSEIIRNQGILITIVHDRVIRVTRDSRSHLLCTGTTVKQFSISNGMIFERFPILFLYTNLNPKHLINANQDVHHDMHLSIESNRAKVK